MPTHPTVIARWRPILMLALAGTCAPCVLAQSAEPQGDSYPELVEVVPNELPGHEPGIRRKKTAPVEEEKPAPAEEPATLEEEEAEWWWEWDRATGNWWGARPALEKFGITISGSYTLNFSSVVSGGRRRESSYMHLLDANINADLEKLVGLNGATIFADFYSIAGDGTSEDAGDFQGVNDLESGNVDQLAELWYEQTLFDGFLRFKVGKVDACTEFAFIDAISEFSNSSAAQTPTIFVMPTYPDPATSVNVFVYPTEHLYAGVGVYDGATMDGINTGGRGPATFFSDKHSDRWFFIGEMGVGWDSLGPLGAGHVTVGGWGHTGEFDRFDGGTSNGTQGIYAHIESMLWKRLPDDPDDEQGLNAFIQFGHASDDVSEVGTQLGFGISLLGTFDGRPDDATGVYVSWVDLSDKSGAGFDEDETVIEWFYKVQVTPFVSIRPDVQVVFNPSGRSDLDTAVVLMLRMTVEF